LYPAQKLLSGRSSTGDDNVVDVLSNGARNRKQLVVVRLTPRPPTLSAPTRRPGTSA